MDAVPAASSLSVGLTMSPSIFATFGSRFKTLKDNILKVAVIVQDDGLVKIVPRETNLIIKSR